MPQRGRVFGRDRSGHDRYHRKVYKVKLSPMRMSIIRKAEITDAEKIISLEKRWQEESPFATRVTRYKKRDILRDVKRPIRNPFYVATVGQKVVGFIYGELCKARESIPAFEIRKGELLGTIKALYLLPEFRGKDLGKALLRAILKHFGTNKARSVKITASSHNLRSLVAYYEKHGFKARTTNMILKVKSSSY